ncbi:hypothetical protein LIX17_00420 [Mycobacterium avium subsp. hominissuis]|uniref:hypothetical protein n=1 Tax=Mycobacterium avium TaxID=1764 RepID=UPI0012BB704E|nr:hypothetical protein [Mycobacterium avium]MCA2335871.1 hypothetical protein [Mycobacterium avium]MCA4735886.1 hypothetical protein [Mycobacterium avium subsp. hominissuis]MCA4740937.1 hypothetical protein [Mycobacterium avium subsp. hominissuis]MCA4745427.1 hypothetical protein [Mycobacterium avium subsp. hominissuis]MCA4765327.1 hypothetical protein [Mycobacterium avium subsp. hominissuis]
MAAPFTSSNFDSSPHFGGLVMRLLFRMARAAMPEIAMESVTALMRTKNRRGREPIRIGQVTPSVIRIERVAAMCAGPDLASHIAQGTRDTAKSALFFGATAAIDVAKN